ncbi:MAG TPA: hypothetical protein PK772_07085 [Chitinophagaceae bacterium]|nr:hypothetical protein [Chitinophagaceae bacterium]
MQLKLNIAYDQLIELIKQLPADKIRKVKAAIIGANDVDKKKKDIKPLQKLLLEGSIMMSDKEFRAFNQNRKQMNQWRKRPFA